MGYFSNGTEGMSYEERYCSKCIHGTKECPVWEAHMHFAYALCNEKEHPGKVMLDMLIPPVKPYGNGRCVMFIETSRVLPRTARTGSSTETATMRDPVRALLAGRTHYRCRVPEIRGEPTLAEILAINNAECAQPMEAIEGQGGQVIGYRCPSCGTTASVTGRTEHGPREERTWYQGEETVLREPNA